MPCLVVDRGVDAVLAKSLLIRGVADTQPVKLLFAAVAFGHLGRVVALLGPPSAILGPDVVAAV